MPCTTYSIRPRTRDLAQNTGYGADSEVTTTGCTAGASAQDVQTNTILPANGGTFSLIDGQSRGLTLTVPTGYSSSTAQFSTFGLYGQATLPTVTPTPISISIANPTTGISSTPTETPVTQSGEKKIIVTVVDSSGAGIPGVPLTATNSNASGTTGQDGSVELTTDQQTEEVEITDGEYSGKQTISIPEGEDEVSVTLTAEKMQTLCK